MFKVCMNIKQSICVNHCFDALSLAVRSFATRQNEQTEAKENEKGKKKKITISDWKKDIIWKIKIAFLGIIEKNEVW